MKIFNEKHKNLRIEDDDFNIAHSLDIRVFRHTELLNPFVLFMFKNNVFCSFLI